MKVKDIREENSLIVLCGGSGSGKTTFGKELRDIYNYHLIARRDIIKEFMIPLFLKEFPNSEYTGKTLYTEANKWYNQNIAGIESLFLDYGLPDDVLRVGVDSLRSISEVENFANSTARFIGFYADYETRVKRMLGRKDKHIDNPGKGTQEDWIRTMLLKQEATYGHFDTLSFMKERGDLVIDTSDLTPKEVFQYVSAKLNN